MGGIGTEVHQVGDGPAGTAFGDSLEQFSNLEEEHHEDCFGELGGRTGQETDSQGPERGDAHQEILVQGFPVGQGFARLFQGIPADGQEGDQIEQQVLPGGPVGLLFDKDGDNEEDGGQDDLDDPSPGSFLIVVMVMMCLLVAVVAVFRVRMMMVSV